MYRADPPSVGNKGVGGLGGGGNGGVNSAGNQLSPEMELLTQAVVAVVKVMLALLLEMVALVWLY